MYRFLLQARETTRVASTATNVLAMRKSCPDSSAQSMAIAYNVCVDRVIEIVPCKSGRQSWTTVRSTDHLATVLLQRKRGRGIVPRSDFDLEKLKATSCSVGSLPSKVLTARILASSLPSNRMTADYD